MFGINKQDKKKYFNYATMFGSISEKSGTFAISGMDLTPLPVKERYQVSIKGFPYEGVKATLDDGSTGSHISVDRVAAGAILLGPVGAVIGGLARKSASDYILFEFPDGKMMVAEVPKRKRAESVTFIRELNRMAGTTAE